MNNMNNNFSNKFIVLSIVLLMLCLIKGFMYSTYLTIDYFDYEKSGFGKKIYDFFDKYFVYICNFVDGILLLIASYIVFFRKNNNILTTLFCFMLMIKFILPFLLLHGLLKKLNIQLDNDTKEKLFKFKNINDLLTNAGLFFITAYMLKIIFLN